MTDGFTCCVTSIVPCSENFDAVTPPALPAQWTAVTALDCVNSNPWATTTNTPDSAPNAAFVNDPNCISDEHLNSRPFPIISATAVLTFRHNFNMEAGFDGGVVEVSTNGGTSFQDIIAAGGTFVAGTQAYNRTISVNFGSPIGGRQAFSSNSGGYVTTSINLLAAFNGQSVIVRWRRATNSSVSGVGWFVDTISVSGSNCAGAPCTITCPADVTVSNDPDQCGAVVNYSAPMTTGTCGTVTCTPPAGSFFPVGTTTVTCTVSDAAGNTASCTFNITVNDTQPPVIACPANVVAVSPTPTSTGAVVCYPPPTASDNCPGVTTLCTPPSGSTFPVGVTTVSCTATDASGKTATCAFTVSVFNARLQDDSNPATVLLWNTTTGQYIFRCSGTTFTGTGKVINSR